jgi:hypothetical protein
MRNHLAVVVAAGLLSACGGDDSDGKSNATVRCVFADNFCDAITASMTSSQRTALSTACTSGGGSFAEGACPTAGMVAGHCHYTGDTVEMMTGVPISGATADEYYASASWTSVDAQAYCETPPAGTWVP